VAPTTPASSRGRKPADTKPAHSVRSPSTGTQDGRRGGGTHHRANIRPTKVVAKPAPLSVVVKPIIPLPSGPVMLPSVISVRELAPLLRTTTAEMIKKLMELKVFATINQSLNYDTASLIAEELGIETKAMAEEKPQQAGPSMVVRTTVAASDQDKLQPRPPVVTILGHVDHGKTSLLDAIRSANVAAGEAGGITQHIGAYQVEKQGRKITFLDTPGHAAFTAMRARGAQVTDVAVLVVAADDGVMPQTKEAIAHARAANVPIIVALNKIDRETAEPQRVMRQLSEAGVTVEEWGGDTPMVKVSARKLIGIDELLEMILLVADVGELKANPERSALGTVVEAEMDRSRGPVATMLVQQGTLRAGDYVVVNDIYGRVRAMFNERDQKLEEAGPSTPVVVLGLPSVPRAGDTFKVAADERAARAEAQAVSDTQAQTTGRAAKALSLDDLYAQMQAGKIKELNVVLKADVQGSLEPIRNSLEKLSGEELRVRILHEATGAISESDVSLALASGAIVIGFHVEPDPAAERLARNEGVDIRTYSIIYNLIEDVEKALKGLLEPKFKEVITGHAEVRALLKVSKRNVAGCYITNGKATRSGQARVLRAGKSAYDGRVASLKRFTEDVREVLTNFECGIMLENFEDVKQGDVIEFYHKEKEE
jgi:translation initiation factor IF-2